MSLAVLLVATGLAAILWAAPVARANSLDVCASGCSYSTIQAAVNAASSGDTIQVAAGTYDEHVGIPGSLTNLTISGAGPGTASGCVPTVDTCIDGTGSTSYGHVFAINSGASMTLENLTVQHGSVFCLTGARAA